MPTHKELNDAKHALVNGRKEMQHEEYCGKWEDCNENIYDCKDCPKYSPTRKKRTFLSW